MRFNDMIFNIGARMAAYAPYGAFSVAMRVCILICLLLCGMEAAATSGTDVDSLRSSAVGAPVVVEGDTLFVLYAGHGSYSATDRAGRIARTLVELGETADVVADSLKVTDNGEFTEILHCRRLIISLSDDDAAYEATTRRELAARLIPIIADKLDDLQRGKTLLEVATRVMLFILVLMMQYSLFRLINYLFRRLRRQIVRFKQRRLRPVVIRDYELLNVRQLGRVLILLNNVARYAVLLLLLILTVPMLFAIFPQTEALAWTILHYILDPVKMVGRSILDYIPNLFIIIVIWTFVRYLIKGLHYIASEVENEKLKIHGFYPDWAQTTFNIVRFLLYAFMVAIIYPYLPGAHSGVFQGISVFVGLIISLGSSAVIGNIISGLVITYMRPFKVGDRIKLNETTGNVIEKTPFVTRLRTPKNEVVTIPNSFIMSSHTINYSESARRYGLIIHTLVTVGYEVPWRQVHQLLIDAARLTPGVLEHPQPFVLETELHDYYTCYQINAYIHDVDRQPDIISDLMERIQDIFAEAGIELVSPHYISARDGNASTVPPKPDK